MRLRPKMCRIIYDMAGTILYIHMCVYVYVCVSGNFSVSFIVVKQLFLSFYKNTIRFQFIFENWQLYIDFFNFFF